MWKIFCFSFKSKVRGVAKNPCDHAQGGGNGKHSKKVASCILKVV